MKRAYAAAVLVISCILALSLLWLPEWMVNRYSGKPLSRYEYTNAVDEYRKTLAQIMGGGALLVGLYFTWRTTRTAEDGRITDRFSKAVEQLGATNTNGTRQIEPRLGGIYSLERIARDSKRDARAIVEILCAYVRENAPIVDGAERVKVGTDIQAILNFLSRFRPQFRNDPTLVFDLNTTELFMADMSACELNGADLRKAFLERADISRGHLESADLTNAYLSRAKLTKAKLTNCSLYRANLVSADLYGCDLLGANLSEANLTKANLKKAIVGLVGNNSTNFRGTILKDANLVGVDLSYVSGLSARQVLSAVRDETTILPEAVEKELRALASAGLAEPSSRTGES